MMPVMGWVCVSLRPVFCDLGGITHRGSNDFWKLHNAANASFHGISTQQDAVAQLLRAWCSNTKAVSLFPVWAIHLTAGLRSLQIPSNLVYSVISVIMAMEWGATCKYILTVFLEVMFQNLDWYLNLAWSLIYLGKGCNSR